jgi:magnesium transporter
MEARVEVVRRLARRGAHAALRRALAKSRAVDIAAAISHLAPTEQRLVMGSVEDDEVAADVLARVDEDDLNHLVDGMDFERLVTLLDTMDVDDEADVIDRLPEELHERVLAAIQDRDKVLVEDILAYPDDSAGGIMQPLAFRLNDNLTCRDAISALHETHDELETVFYLYVENDVGQLVGVISLRALLTNPPSTPLREIMSTDIIAVGPAEDQEEVARLVSRYDLLAVPVVDEDRSLLGIVTVDDVVDVIKEEALEDMMLMAGVGDDPDPNAAGVFQAARQRGTWLLVTLLGGIGMAELIGVFETALQQQAVLAGFIPVMLGTGGNVGIQAATVAVRNIALGQHEGLSFGGTLWREARVGSLLGLGFAVALGIYSLLRWMDEPLLSVAIAASILGTVISAAALGTAVPMTLNRLGIDPAVATGPFVTTGIDMIAILIYFGTCSAILGLG